MSDISVIINNEIIEVTEFNDEIAISFPSGTGGGGVTDHGALTGLADNDHLQYQLSSGLGTAAFVNVGTGASQIVQLTAASKLPAVDGSLLTNLPSGGGGSPGGSTTQVQYNNAGAFAGHSGFTYNGAGVATLSAGLVAPLIRPVSDSTTAVKITKADGTTAVMTVDTTNKWIGIETTPTMKLDVNGAVQIRPLDSLSAHLLNIQAGSNQGAGYLLRFLNSGGTLLWGVDSNGQINLVGNQYILFANSRIGNTFNLISGNPGGLGIQSDSTISVATGGVTERIRINSSGYISVGQTTATALLDIAASTTTRASLRIRSGTAPTTPNAGDLWFDGTNLKFYDGSVTRTITWS